MQLLDYANAPSLTPFCVRDLHSCCPLQDLCHKLKTMSKTDRERLYVVEDDVTGHVEVDCFLDEMRTFYRVSTPRAELIQLSFDFENSPRRRASRFCSLSNLEM